MQQHMTALQRANHVRLARAEIRRRLHAGELSAVDVLDDVPDVMARVSVGEFPTWLPRIGEYRAGKILTDNGRRIVGHSVPLGCLSLATLRRIAVRLPELSNSSRRWSSSFAMAVRNSRSASFSGLPASSISRTPALRRACRGSDSAERPMTLAYVSCCWLMFMRVLLRSA